ncbi:MAG: hypothetical protein RH942_14135 [Kiloniellaceae bacterium]
MSDAKNSALLSAKEAMTQFGVFSRHEFMANGELRFRLAGADGSGCARTVAGRTGGWQNSHKHERSRETYIVQSGWMLLASLREGIAQFHRLAPGEIAAAQPGVPHNVYLPAAAVIHTVKHGDVGTGDWVACPTLDHATKALSEAEALEKIASRQSA